LAQSGLVDLIVFHHPLNVVTGLCKGNQLDPVDHFIEWLSAWISEALDPLRDAARAGIVGDEGENVGAAEIGNLFAQEVCAKGGVVARVGGQAVLRIG
jgi:hypothetical protein